MVSTIDQNCAHTHTHSIIDMSGHYVCMYLYVDKIYVYYIYYVYSHNLCISMQCIYLLYACLTQVRDMFKIQDRWRFKLLMDPDVPYTISLNITQMLMMLPTDDIPKLACKAAMNFCGMRAMISFRRALVEHHHAAYMSREGRLYYTLGSHGAEEEAGGRCGDTARSGYVYLVYLHPWHQKIAVDLGLTSCVIGYEASCQTSWEAQCGSVVRREPWFESRLYPRPQTMFFSSDKNDHLGRLPECLIPRIYMNLYKTSQSTYTVHASYLRQTCIDQQCVWKEDS